MHASRDKLQAPTPERYLWHFEANSMVEDETLPVFVRLDQKPSLPFERCMTQARGLPPWLSVHTKRRKPRRWHVLPFRSFVGGGILVCFWQIHLYMCGIITWETKSYSRAHPTSSSIFTFPKTETSPRKSRFAFKKKAPVSTAKITTL